MNVFYDQSRVYSTARLHPYAAAEPGHTGYVDFKKHPDQIEEALEELRPFAEWEAIKTFYEFLRWINGPDSELESNDCGLRGPRPHTDKHLSHSLSVYGRICINFRKLQLNASPDHTDWLCGKLMQTLAGTASEFQLSEGVVGFSLNPVIQLELSKGIWRGDGIFFVPPGEKQTGEARHLSLSFWAYGDDDASTFSNLDHVFRNIRSACETISAEISAGLQRQQAGVDQGN